MSKLKSNGTVIFGLIAGAIVRFKCFRAVDLGNDTVSKVDISCLDEDTKTYMAGSVDPAEGSLTIQLDDENITHAKLLALAESNENILWYMRAPVPKAIDGTAIPVATGAGQNVVVTLPETATWVSFSGYLTSVGPTVEMDDVWTYAFPLVRTSKIVTTLKDPTP